ncbi:MAG: helix-hairpin-helix domain-containing protein [Arcobacteraceae bacterium]
MKIFVMMAFAMSLLFGAVDINNASKNELMGLKGIGEKKADEILSVRKKGKCFKNVDDLTSVKGIGSKFIEKNKKNLSVGKCKNK